VLSKDESTRTWETFLEQKYIQFCEERDGRSWYEVTIEGNTIAHASAAKPISRKTAEKKLNEFMQRVQEINCNQEYAYIISTVVLFGSVLSDAPNVNDVDLAVKLKRRVDDDKIFREMVEKRKQVAMSKGKVFRTFFEQTLWAQQEIYLFLKARSRAISLHEIEDIQNLNIKSYKTLLGKFPA